MKPHLRTVCLALIAFAAMICSFAGARADVTGDSDFCYGGWVIVKTKAMGPIWYCPTDNGAD